MTQQQATTTANAWREQIAAYQALLDALRPRLIDAEAHWPNDGGHQRL